MMQSARIETPLPEQTTPSPVVRCRDGCGSEAPNNGGTPPGWQMMDFGKGYRCPLCVKVLRLVNGYSASEHTTAAIKR